MAKSLPSNGASHHPLPHQPILLVTDIAEGENCAAAIAKQFNRTVDLASSRREAVAMLRRKTYSIVALDNSLIDAAGDEQESVYCDCGLAIPLEINFATSGPSRIIRQIRAALTRRQLEQSIAARAAAVSLESDLRDTVAGLLLQSQLALAEPALPPPIADKLRLMAELAGSLRKRLDQANTPV